VDRLLDAGVLELLARGERDGATRLIDEALGAS
jgi:hypothetical protein